MFVYKHKKGFTLIELLVVIAIIGLLSTLAVVALNGSRAKARDAKRKADLRAISIAMGLYFDENNKYPLTPSSGATWVCLGHEPTEKCWQNDQFSGNDSVNDALAPYMSQIPDDPLNQDGSRGDAYLYRSDVPTGGTRTEVGAYLHWYYETGPADNSSCAPGFYGGTNESGPYCWWMLGDSTTD